MRREADALEMKAEQFMAQADTIRRDHRSRNRDRSPDKQRDQARGEHAAPAAKGVEGREEAKQAPCTGRRSRRAARQSHRRGIAPQRRRGEQTRKRQGRISGGSNPRAVPVRVTAPARRWRSRNSADARQHARLARFGCRLRGRHAESGRQRPRRCPTSERSSPHPRAATTPSVRGEAVEAYRRHATPSALRVSEAKSRADRARQRGPEHDDRIARRPRSRARVRRARSGRVVRG